MSINLTPELEELINRKVQSGRYRSAAEVVREGLRLLDEQSESNSTDRFSDRTSKAVFGSAKGRVFISKDFDSPLDEFQEYM